MRAACVGEQGEHVVERDRRGHEPGRVARTLRVTPRVVDLLAEEAPDEPPPLHEGQVPQQLQRRPARRHLRPSELRVGRATAPSRRRWRGRTRGSAAKCVSLPVRARAPAPPSRRPDPVAVGVPVLLDLLARLHPRRLAGHLRVVGRERHLAARQLVVERQQRLERVRRVVDASPTASPVAASRSGTVNRLNSRGSVTLGQLLPGQRRRDRRAGDRPQGVRRGDGAVAAVLVEVDEDPLARAPPSTSPR